MYNLEKGPLSNYPIPLLTKELNNPLAVIKSFYEYIDFPTARKYMQLWFKFIFKMSIEVHGEFNILLVNTYLAKILEAPNLIYTRGTNETNYKATMPPIAVSLFKRRRYHQIVIRPV